MADSGGFLLNQGSILLRSRKAVSGRNLIVSDLGKIFKKALGSLGKLQCFMMSDHGTSCGQRCFRWTGSRPGRLRSI